MISGKFTAFLPESKRKEFQVQKGINRYIYIKMQSLRIAMSGSDPKEKFLTLFLILSVLECLRQKIVRHTFYRVDFDATGHGFFMPLKLF
jgi:hypothetical protein